MSEHTKGRLYTYEKYGIAYLLKHGAEVRSSVFDTRDLVATNIKPEDARRLAAGWNHFEGVETDSIESMPTFNEIHWSYSQSQGDLAVERDQTLRELAAARALLREVLKANNFNSRLKLYAKVESYLDACDTLEGAPNAG